MQADWAGPSNMKSLLNAGHRILSNQGDSHHMLLERLKPRLPFLAVILYHLDQAKISSPIWPENPREIRPRILASVVLHAVGLLTAHNRQKEELFDPFPLLSTHWPS